MPGGDRFVAVITIPDLTPRYEAKAGNTVVIAKALDLNIGSADGPPCVRNGTQLRCEWAGASGVYSIWGNADLFPANTEDVLRAVEELLDGCRLSAE